MMFNFGISANSVPVGTIVQHPASELKGYLLCNGASPNRLAYKKLFAVLGSIYGPASSTNFKLPDFRGRFIRGAGGSSAAIGTTQNDALQNITGTFCLDGSSLNNQPYVSGAFSVSSAKNGSNHQSTSGNNAPYINFDTSRVVRTANETRPINHSLNFFIKY